MMKQFLLTIALVLTMKASAQTKIDGIYYYFNSLSKTATVSNPYDDYLVGIEPRLVYSGNVIIPSKVTYNGETYNVTHIDAGAFYNSIDLTSITIPNSVTTIGSLAFNCCKRLISLVIPNSVTFIGDNAFSGCSGLTSIKVESGNKVYDSRDNCNALIETKSNTLIIGCTTTTIPSGITSISYNAFINCSGLTSVFIPNSVTSIGEYAFYNCSGLTSINVEAGNPKYDSREKSNAIIETASNTLIAGCKNSTIPNGVTSIGDHAFYSCSGLTSVTIPNSVTSIGRSAFSNCSGLTSVTIPNSVTSIGSSAFFNCSGLTSVTIPNSVTSIGSLAFSNCSGLTFITIPASVTSIGYDAFRNCSGLTSITIPASVTSIEGGAFHGTTWYNNQPDGMVYLGNYVYEYKGQMPTNTQIIIREGTTGIVGSAFWCRSGLTSITIPNSVTSIGESAFYGCSGLTSVTIPTSVTSIGYGAFEFCSGLFSVIIPNSVTSIGDDSFSYCSGLSSITIPNSVISIGSSAFYGCSGLSSITIPNSVTSIGSSAFYGCIGLTSVTIPESVTSIGGSAFHGTTWYNNQPDGMIYLGNLIYKYKGQMPTNTHIIIREGTTGIAGSAFANCSGLTSITIPNSVTSIGGRAFDGCSGLTSVTFPSSVTNIEGFTFSGCSGLTSVTIPSSVTSIEEYAFSGCRSMISVISEIEDPFAINNSVFNGIPSNAQLIVPKGTKAKYQATAGWNQFTNIIEVGGVGYTFEADGIYYQIGANNTVSVTSGKTKYSGNIVIPNQVTYLGTTYSVTSISNEAFDNCDNLQEVILPQIAYDNGIPANVIKYVTYSKNPMRVVVTSKGATTATMNIYPIDDSGHTDEDNYSTMTMQGLTPGQHIQWKLDDENYGILSEKTEALNLEVQPAKPTSKTKARLLAKVKEQDDDTHFGFEWLRYDAPSNMTPNRVLAPLYDGQIVGTLNNLNPDVYYKYRPYYKSDNGSMYYGEWESFITGDADVFFEPETHTKEVAEVTSVSAQLSGVWIEGTEDIEEKGFEYWVVAGSSTRTVGKDVKKVTVGDNQTTITINSLFSDTEYGYRSYLKTASGTTYGEEKTFKTISDGKVKGDVNGDGVVNEADANDVATFIMGKIPTGFNKDAADLNKDDKVNVADIVLINKIIKKDR